MVLTSHVSRQPRRQPNCIDAIKFQRAVPTVAYIGRLDAEKHIPCFLKAFVRVREAQPDAHLLVVGDGTAREDLITLAHKYNITRHVTFTGA